MFYLDYSKEQIDPHIFSLSIECIKQIIENKKNQAIVISGESGAGKTENTKLAMKFLATLGI
jgi:myosin heavy subunit